MGDEWRHDGYNVRIIQKAHADCVEAVFREDASIPGNPKNIVIESFGDTRTFYRNTEHMQNRIFFTGGETPEDIDHALHHFVDRNADCIMDVNPGNLPVLSHLLARGCSVKQFRGVWVRTRSLEPDGTATKLDCYRVDADTYRRMAPRIHDGEPVDQAEGFQPDPGFAYYLGFDGERPVASASMFYTGESAYLQWAETHRDYRRRGYHSHMIRTRVQDAFEMGAKRAFSVTEFDSQSSYDLQRHGFTLAYNSLLMTREPEPLG